MSSVRRTGSLLLFILVGIACSDHSPVPTVENPASLEAALMASTCDVRDLKKHARDYFSRPEDGTARDIVADIESACDVGNDQATTSFVFDLLTLVEGVIDNGNAGTPAVGNLLVQEALSFATFDCVTDGTCEPVSGDFTGALSVGGAFKVVASTAGGADPIVSRGLPLGDTWVLEVGSAGDWLSVFGQRSLVYGFPANGQIPLQESPLPPIQYEWEVIPDAKNGFLAQPVVGVCYVAVNVTGIPTVQRNSTLLEPSDVSTCGTLTSALPQGFGDRAKRFAAWLVGANPLRAAAQFSRGTGGRPTDFSTFAAVDAVVEGHLEFVTQPDPVNSSEEPIGGPVQVRAVTAQGTPIEHVLIELSAEVNNGSPVVISGNQAYTQEGGGVATFSGVSINKPGGYILCAEAIATDGVSGTTYQIAGACSNALHIRN